MINSSQQPYSLPYTQLHPHRINSPQSCFFLCINSKHLSNNQQSPHTRFSLPKSIVGIPKSISIPTPFPICSYEPPVPSFPLPTNPISVPTTSLLPPIPRGPIRHFHRCHPFAPTLALRSLALCSPILQEPHTTSEASSPKRRTWVSWSSPEWVF